MVNCVCVLQDNFWILTNELNDLALTACVFELNIFIVEAIDPQQEGDSAMTFSIANALHKDTFQHV